MGASAAERPHPSIRLYPDHHLPCREGRRRLRSRRPPDARRHARVSETRPLAYISSVPWYLALRKA